jgi:hypothetical protein
MLSLALLSISGLSFTDNTTVEYRRTVFFKYLRGEYDDWRWNTTQYRAIGLLTVEAIDFVDEDFDSLSQYEKGNALFICSTIIRPLPNSFFVRARKCLTQEFSNRDIQHRMRRIALDYFTYQQTPEIAPEIAQLLLQNHQNYSDMYHSAIALLNDIGTPDEIAVIDKAKENGLLADDGKFWIKAADAKKAILARAEEKKKAELKAKPLDK